MKTDAVKICIGVAVVIGVVFFIYYNNRNKNNYEKILPSGRACYCKRGESYCGTCEDCGRPGHTSHFPGAVPYTGAWCESCYLKLKDRFSTELKDDLDETPKIQRRPPITPQYRGFRQHPVLAYQRAASYDTHPANYGDPIRIPSGRIGSGPAPSGFKRAYGSEYEGPAVGRPLNIPVPQGSLKLSSEKYRYPFYYQKKPLSPYDYFRPYGPNSPEMQSEIVVSDTPFYKRGLFPGSPTVTSGTVPFISSVSSFAPFPEVQTAWEKIGMLQTEDAKDSTILNLFRRPIAPLQDLFEYSIQDKNGFIIPLKNMNFLKDGDTIATVPGKEALGSWKVNIYVKNKWVWA